MKEPEKFAGKYVTVSGYWVRGFEWSYLTNDPQVERGSPIWVEAWSMPGSRKVDWQRIRQVIDAAYETAGIRDRRTEERIWIRCTGWFEHREFPATTTDGQIQIGFGHMGAYKSQLIIDNLLEARVEPARN